MKYTSKTATGATALVLLWLVVACLVSCDNEERDNMARNNSLLVPEQVAGWQLQDEVSTFDRRSIFDYIDGAGEVYLSFSFRDVAVYKFQREGFPEITAEIFDMGSAEDAYGVFSYAREFDEPGIGQAFEYRGSILCFWQDRYYVCVTCYEQTDDTKEVLPTLAREIGRRLPDEGSRPGLIEVLPADGLVPHSERFFHLHSTLNYHFFVARENLLQMSPDTRAVMACYTPGTIFLLCVEYPDKQKAGEGYRGFMEGYLTEAKGERPVQTEDGKWTAARLQDRFVTVIFDATSEDQAAGLLENLETRLVENTN